MNTNIKIFSLEVGYKLSANIKITILVSCALGTINHTW